MKNNNRDVGKSFRFMYHKWRKEEAWRLIAYFPKYLKVMFEKYSQIFSIEELAAGV